MNRQLRRAQEKQDKKQEKEKARRREERRSRLRQLRAGRRKDAKSPAAANKDTAATDGAGEKPRSGRLPGRFSGVLAAVTVFFISLQGVAPAEEEVALRDSLVYAGFYLMLGYFATMWFMRRGASRPLLVTVIGGAFLAASVTVTGLVQGRQLDPILVALVLPALLLGALLGRLVYRATPR